MKLLELPSLPDLTHELHARVQGIPHGQVVSFGDLATSLGDRHAAIWVFQAIRQHPHTANCHCHRVVRSTGELAQTEEAGRYQRDRLESEGVRFEPVSRTKSARVSPDDRFEIPGAISPLTELQQWLDLAAKSIKQTRLKRKPGLVAGLDVAYRAPDIACGAAVVVDPQRHSILWTGSTVLPVAFRYIPGYLALRELPVLMTLVEQMHRESLHPDVVFIDGQGRLHPRRAGIATSFAAVSGLSSIGVGKSLLCGRIQPSATESDVAPVVHEGEVLAGALHVGAKKPVFVSVGGGITLPEAIDLTRQMLHGRRLPLPTYEADRLSKKLARMPDTRSPLDHGATAPTNPSSPSSD